MTANKMLYRFSRRFIFCREYQSMSPFAAGFCIDFLPRAGAIDHRRKRLDILPTVPALQPQRSFCPVNRQIFFPTPSPNQTLPSNIDRRSIDHAVVVIHAKPHALGSNRTEEHCSDMEVVVGFGLAGLHLRLESTSQFS